MKLSERGLTLIKEFEGFSPTIYLDQAGLETIGYGHLITQEEKLAKTFEGKKLTPGEATELLAQDVEQSEAAVERLVKVPLTQNRYDTLCSFSFNLGAQALKGSTLLKKLNRGDYNVADEFLKWSKVRNPKTGKLETSNGLLRRRKREAELWSE